MSEETARQGVVSPPRLRKNSNISFHSQGREAAASSSLQIGNEARTGSAASPRPRRTHGLVHSGPHHDVVPGPTHAGPHAMCPPAPVTGHLLEQKLRGFTEGPRATGSGLRRKQDRRTPASAQTSQGHFLSVRRPWPPTEQQGPHRILQTHAGTQGTAVSHTPREHRPREPARKGRQRRFWGQVLRD